MLREMISTKRESESEIKHITSCMCRGIYCI